MRELPSFPDLRRTALMLDFDGTLVDIAPAPDLVVVPDDLRRSLDRLAEASGGTVAIVTGRSLDQIDHFLPGFPGAVASEHGAVIRRTPGGPVERATMADMPEDWRVQGRAWADAHTGVKLEEKSSGFVLHFRSCPDVGPDARAFLDALIAGEEARFHVLSAKMAWELRPSGADKGSAVEALMREAPFTGRHPIFIGDDVTDEHGIAACRNLGGSGHLVPDAFGEPADVRAWLHDLAERAA